MSRALVINYRKRHDIPAYQGYKFGQPGHPPGGRKEVPGAERPPQPFRGRRSALDPYADQLGKVPDAEIARLAGVTPENVRTYRVRRGIPAEWSRSGARGGAPAPQPAPAAPAPSPVAVPAAPAPGVSEGSARTVFLVTVETDAGVRQYALVATNIVEAALRSVSRMLQVHPGAAIKGIQRVADLLP